MRDLSEVGKHRAYDVDKFQLWGFIRRSRAFVFSNRAARGHATGVPFDRDRTQPHPTRHNLVTISFLDQAPRLAELLWFNYPVCRTASADTCFHCGQPVSAGHAQYRLLPSALEPKPDSQPEPFPWVGPIHPGCIRTTRLQRIAERDDRDSMGVQFASEWKLAQGQCYKLSLIHI